MNLYILVEGKRTEKKIYPAWLKVLIPELTRVDGFDKVDENNFYIFSSNGYPFKKDRIERSIMDINSINKYDHLLICLDSDELTYEERYKEVEEFINNSGIESNVKIEIIVQNRCLETWLLGYRKAFPRDPRDSEFKKYKEFYDVSRLDPEMMEKPPDFKGSISQFHYKYLTKMLKENDMNYSKTHPGVTKTEKYLYELQKRIKNYPDHLASFSYFVQFIQNLRKNSIW